MKYIITAPSALSGNIILPSSKSISNRALILNALSSNPVTIENLSDCDDTKTMIEAFNTNDSIINVGAAGTAMRFLSAYLSQKRGEWILTGTERMRNRPIKILVDALRQIGAKIEYLGKEGFPPLKIHGQKLKGGNISLNGDVSSQFISAIMMIAPSTEKGIKITLEGNVISRPYIDMTKKMMEYFGIEIEEKENSFIIPPQSYKADKFIVESDWSAASYWYEILFLSNNPVNKIHLKGLYSDSIQGDSEVASLFKKLGVNTQFNNEDTTITNSVCHSDFFEYHFANEPDLAQTFVVTCCLKNIRFRFTGLQSLKIKETDRITALKTELGKLGYDLEDENNSILSWDGSRKELQKDIIIDTYEDHRMAMAFAPVALIRGQITINNPEVVSKSYPSYWDDLKKTGFVIEEINN